MLSRSFYADDLVHKDNSVEEAIKVYEDAKFIIKEAGIVLRKWRTNSEERQQAMFQDEVSDNLNNVGILFGEPLNVLGVLWNPSLRVNLSIFLDKSGIRKVGRRLQHLKV